AIKGAKAGSYVLKISFMGFSTVTRELVIGSEEIVDLGVINLAEATAILSEVEVLADHVPIQIQDDTINYNADAFKVQPNDVVEDLLKRLPGIEVDKDGGIKAQGEEVQNVFVDGKEFFGSDPKMATKNLPADAVDKVQVYDKLSDMAEFSGIDDGERSKTINLELKEDKKKGMFGAIEAGYGHDAGEIADEGRYSTKLNLNRFTKSSQLSVLGMANDVNQQGFSFNEYINFSGGMSRLMGGGGRFRFGGGGGGPQISNGLSDGFVNTLAGGVNFNVELGKKLDIRSSYFYNGIENNIAQDVFRQNFIVDETFETFEDATQTTESDGHRVNLIAELEIDSTTEIELRSNASFNNGDYISNQFTETYEGQGQLDNTLLTDYNSMSDGIDLNSDLYLRKRFGAKRGRTMTANFSLRKGDDDGEARLTSLQNFLLTGDEEYIDQMQQDIGDDMNWGARLSYTEPIGKNKWLEFNYRYQNNESNSDQDVFDLDPVTGVPTRNSELSTTFQRDFVYHQAGTTFKFNSPKSSLNIGVQYQDSDLRGIINQDESPIAKEYTTVLPSLRYRYEFATARSIRFDYRTSIDVPSLQQLSPLIDNSNPQRIYVGNPDLKAEYQHRANVHFHSFSQFSFTSIFAMLSGTITKNKIVNSTEVDRVTFKETQRPVNIDNDYRLTGYASFGTPLKFIRSRVELNSNVSYNNSKLFINTIENDVDRWTKSFGLSFSSMNSEVLEYQVGTRFSNTTTEYSEDRSFDQDFLTQTYYADVTVNFLKTWSVSTSYDLNVYKGDQFEGNEELPLWKASLSKFVFKDKRAEIKLSMFDVLDENRGINRTSESNYLEEIRTNSLGRYYMLSFIYSIKGFGQGDTGMRFMRHGRRR
ncbi:MAG: outer membrane beta-barrel protein, partial [Saprospiraceae bacterium]|nr:outer membrane beta-barrel protein [Saprospiraceae bacterium]